MTKPKKHILNFGQVYDFQMIGICSHHSDYRLAWGMNEKLSTHLEKSDIDYVAASKKGITSLHSKYYYKDEENLVEYYLIKNKSLGKYLIPEKPTIDYFLFLYENQIWEIEELIDKLRSIPSVLGVFEFDPEEIDSTEHLVFS